MPIYTFSCNKCGHMGEYFVVVGTKEVDCEKCSFTIDKRVYSNDIPVIRGETCADRFYHVRNQKLPNPEE